MLHPLKNALATSLPPDVLYWMRSVKRAIMFEPPLPWPYANGGGTDVQDKLPAVAIAAPSAVSSARRRRRRSSDIRTSLSSTKSVNRRASGSR